MRLQFSSLQTAHVDVLLQRTDEKSLFYRALAELFFCENRYKIAIAYENIRLRKFAIPDTTLLSTLIGVNLQIPFLFVPGSCLLFPERRNK